MKKMKWIAVLLAAVLAAGVLAGCSAAESLAANGSAAPREDFMYDAVYDGADSVVMESGSSSGKYGTTGTVGSAGVQNQKLIRTMNVEAETDDLDALLAKLDARIAELGGYVENKSVRNGSYSETRRYRSADLTIRIPVSELDAFIEHVKGASNIVSYKENADDITLSYIATESRVAALETEQTRLLELLAKAEDMTDLLLIEERLTDVRTELEEVASQLRLYDNLVDYGTVELSVTQVQEYTVVEEETVWQRMASGIRENWESLCTFAEDLLVLIVVSVPFLIPVAGAALLTFIVVKLATRKRPEKKDFQNKPQDTSE